jgi:hypothetical protein
MREEHTMSSRFTDDLGLVPVGQYVLATAQALLLHLHLEDAPQPRQEAAVAEWLKTHPPGRGMQDTLRSNGFGHLLED